MKLRVLARDTTDRSAQRWLHRGSVRPHDTPLPIQQARRRVRAARRRVRTAESLAWSFVVLAGLLLPLGAAVASLVLAIGSLLAVAVVWLSERRADRERRRAERLTQRWLDQLGAEPCEQFGLLAHQDSHPSWPARA